MDSLILSILILGASVSSGYSGKPSGEWLAEWLNVPYVNQASICHKVSADEVKPVPGTLLVDVDGNYWRSYDEDCDKAVQAVHDFYAHTTGIQKVMATVPARNAGGFYRFFCGAERSEQVCRVAVNAAIVKGCGEGCLLLDADELYAGREDEDIHLTPEIWKDVALHALERLRGVTAQNR